ncbi:MAG: protein kinase [Planctomycetes bacterium]|nr:protein kinase [Planctomycetota bacterium]
MNTADSERDDEVGAAGPENVRCPSCRHLFSPGKVKGDGVFCSSCGSKFNPFAQMNETVDISGPVVDSEESELHIKKSGPAVLDSADSDRIKGMDERFGDYDIISEVARGGMGVVYRARQRTLKRVVALKVLRSGESASEEDLERFMREAKAAASLTHPNIVPIHELNVWKGKHFFTMDYVEGASLDKLVDEGNLTPYQSCELIETIARAIHYAHTRGIIHRDLKPANIIVDTEGRPMITDFGLAVNLASDVRSQRMTRTGAIMGTIPYIPPEQASGHIRDVDERSDVYSLGAVMYEMFTGRPPFSGNTQYELLKQVIHQDPPLPRTINSKIHPDLETICMKCLEKDRERRYFSAAELADDCRRFLHGEVIKARPSTLGYKLKRLVARHRTYFMMGVAIIMISLISLGVIVAGRHETKKLEHEVEKKKTEVEVLEKEKEEKEKELERGWRQEFLTNVGKKDPVTGDMNNAYKQNLLWFDASAGKLDKDAGILVLDGSKKNSKSMRGLVGVPVLFPLDFELTLHVRPPQEGAGVVEIFVNADKKFAAGRKSYVIRLGIPGQPGARIEKDGAALAEKSGFVLSLDQWHRVEVVRTENTLSVAVDNETIMQTGLVTAGVESENSYLGINVVDGGCSLQMVKVLVKGLSKAMTRSLLEVAGTLSLHPDHRLAMKLYERVVKEKDTDRRDHVTALKGYAKCIALSDGGNPQAVIKNCDSLMDSVSTSRKLENGEREYLKGLAFANLNKPEGWEKGLAFFKKAVTAAVPSEQSLLTPGPSLYIGPFDAPGDDGLDFSFGPELNFDADSSYNGKYGIVSWEPIGDPEKQGESLPFTRKDLDLNYTTFYVRRAFSCPNDVPVTIYTGSDDGLTLWVNGENVLSLKMARAVKPRSDMVRAKFHKGRNVVFMKVHNLRLGTGFSLEVVPDGKYHLGMYGRLSQLEQVVTLLHMNDAAGAAKLLREMQVDNGLKTLSEKYSDEISMGGIISYVNDRVDDMLKREKDLDVVFALLEAMRMLYPASGDDLAIRYHRMAMIHKKHKSYQKAETALQEARTLSANWYRPWFDLAMLYFEQGRDADGYYELERLLNSMEGNLELHLEAVRFYLEKVDGKSRNSALAVHVINRALQLSERLDPEVWRLAAKAYSAEGRLPEALDHIKYAISLQEIPNEDDLKMQRELEDAVGMTGEGERIYPLPEDEMQPTAP